MCFYARSDRAKAKKVKGEITGFKRFLRRRGEIVSPYHAGFVWKLGDITTEEDFDKTASYGEVNQGFHCYKTYYEAWCKKSRNEVILMVTIPDGALVHENDEQYCSNQMIVHPMQVTKFVRPKRKRK